MKNQYSCIVVDDEEGAHKVMAHYINQVNSLSLVASFYNAVDALDYLFNNNVDIVFLDVNMPGLSGMEMLETMSERPNVILTTAYKDYAVEGYNYEVVDYLVKPFELKRFLLAIEKVMKRREIKLSDTKTDLSEYLILKVDGSFVKIFFSDILHIQSYGNYVKVFTPQKMYLSQITTHEIESKLKKELFTRIHKSYIVHRYRISKIQGNQIFLDNNTVLPIGSSYKREVVSAFSEI